MLVVDPTINDVVSHDHAIPAGHLQQWQSDGLLLEINGLLAETFIDLNIID